MQKIKHKGKNLCLCIGTILCFLIFSSVGNVFADSIVTIPPPKGLPKTDATFNFSFSGEVTGLTVTTPSGNEYSGVPVEAGKISIYIGDAPDGKYTLKITGSFTTFQVTITGTAVGTTTTTTITTAPTPSDTVAPTQTSSSAATESGSVVTPPPTSGAETSVAPTTTTTTSMQIPKPSEETRKTETVPTTEGTLETSMPSESETNPSDITAQGSTVENTPIMGIAEEDPPPDQNGGIRIPIIDSIFVPTKENPFDLKLWIVISAGSGILIGTLSGVYLRGKHIQKRKRKDSTQYAAEIKINDEGKIVL